MAKDIFRITQIVNRINGIVYHADLKEHLDDDRYAKRMAAPKIAELYSELQVIISRIIRRVPSGTRKYLSALRSSEGLPYSELSRCEQLVRSRVIHATHVSEITYESIRRSLCGNSYSPSMVIWQRSDERTYWAILWYYAYNMWEDLESDAIKTYLKIALDNPLNFGEPVGCPKRYCRDYMVNVAKRNKAC
ncbi:MAG: hypothetical protein GY706_04445 [Bacteroides sp.]|nr:hypothetical protein [Bacteroides sp.]